VSTDSIFAFRTDSKSAFGSGPSPLGLTVAAYPTDKISALATEGKCALDT
jgi:hypothetical protein